jgi:hypothetical protein
MMFPLDPDTSIMLVKQYQAERLGQAARTRSTVVEQRASRISGVRRSTGRTLIRLGESLLDPATSSSPAHA